MLFSAFQLVFVSIIAKILSFAVRIMLARELSSEAMNLYALASPTMVFLIAIVQQGIPSALSKLTAQHGNSTPLFAAAMITMLTAAVVMSAYALALPYFASGFLHHSELIPVLRAILPLLPFVALSGLLKGYLYGRQQHAAANNAQLWEEGSRLIFLSVFFAASDIRDPSQLAATAMASVCVGEIVSCLYMTLRLHIPWKKARSVPKAIHEVPLSALHEVLSISMPMMGSRLSGSLTYFLEPILMLVLIPYTAQEEMVTAYGLLNGYTLPLLTMPGFLSVTLSNYLLPSFTHALAHAQKKKARRQCLLILSCCFLFGALCAFGCFIFHEELFTLFYHTARGSTQLRALALPFLFYALQAPLSALMHACAMSAPAFRDTLYGSLFRLAAVCLLAPLLQERALLLGLCGGMLITTCLHAFRLLCFWKHG